MKIACFGMDSEYKQIDKNLVHVEESLKDLKDCDVIVLPELFTTGFFPRDVRNFVSDKETKKRISSLAKKLHVNIVAGSVISLKNDNIYNTNYTFDRNGELIATYDKIHLFSYAKEDEYFSSGDKICTFELDGVKCGIIICYDLRFPELSQALAKQGVQMIFIVSAWPDERLHHLKTLCLARAIENQVYFVLCNQSSLIKNIKCAGHSMIISPNGEILAEAGEDEEIISADIDLSVVSKIKNTINVFRDKKEESFYN